MLPSPLPPGSEFPLSELLDLSKRLERCWALGDILDAVAPVIDRVLGYPHAWLAVFGQVPGLVTVISHVAVEGDDDELLRKSNSVDIPIAGDPFLAEILAADHVVVVEDARTDPRTNKEVVAVLQNRTIINVPLVLADQNLGTLGLGTFGDEGLKTPLPWHLRFLEAIAGHVAVALDRVNFIAQRDRDQTALQEEKENLRVTLESIGDGVIATDVRGHIARLNSTAARLTGWDEASAVGQPLDAVFRIVNATSRKPVTSPIHQVLEEGVVVGLANHTTLLSRDGTEYQIADSAAPIRDARGVLIGVVLVFRDVTEDYFLRQELDRTSAFLERTAAVARVGGWEVDVSTGRLSWTQEALRLLETPGKGPLSEEEALAFVVPEDRPRIRSSLEVLVSSGVPFDTEMALETPSGKALWVRFQGFPVEEGGRVVRAFGTLHDLTEQKRLESRRRDLEQQLYQAQKLEGLGLLAGGVAHDMNNMLAAISGVVSMQLRRPAPSPEVSRAFATIAKAVDRGRALTSSLLTYTRKTSSVRGVVRWNDLVGEVLTLLEHTTLARVDLVSNLDPDLGEMSGDAGALIQVLMNLCVNALDALEGATGPRMLTITTRRERGDVVVEVADSGPGMSSELMARVREPFFTTKAPGKGTGLGLALASSTVEGHGGVLDIESSLGKGTRVRLRFPGHIVVSQGEAPPTTTPVGGVRSVLVVDDDEMVREVTHALVASFGLEVSSVEGLGPALDLLAAGRSFDLILLDVHMPGVGVAEALVAIRGARPVLPVVLTTGLPDQTVHDLVARTPHTRLLAKPFDLVELQALLA